MRHWIRRVGAQALWAGALGWAELAWAQSAATGPSLAASAAAALPAEAFFQHPSVRDAQLSPSGHQLAITTALGARRVALVLVDLQAPGKVTRAAAFNDADVVRFNWVSNSRLVFSVADLETGSGEDRYTAPGLYGVDADGNALRQLIARRAGQVVTDGQRGGRDALSPEHQLLHVLPPQPGAENDEVIVGRSVFSGQNDVSQVVPRVSA